ncbi:MAG: hypothetical protein ACC645_04260 [Pirellulales bacterium]
MDDPYFLAGTAVPDWLNSVDRRVRARSRRAVPLTEDVDPRVAALARGVVRHHQDDRWFHESAAFLELSFELTRRVREALPTDDGFRPSFLGHILVELLLDAELIAEKPALLEAYYRAVTQVDPRLVSAVVGRIATRPAKDLDRLIPRFVQEGFLRDYVDDARLWMRLNQVMRRVRLPALPATFVSVVADARIRVRAQKNELLTRQAEVVR